MDYNVVSWPSIDVVRAHITPERIVTAAKALPDVTPGVDVDTLTKDDLIVDFSLMHYGMKEKNPLDFVKFYSKWEPNRESIIIHPHPIYTPLTSVTMRDVGGAPAGPGDYSNLMPQYHAE